MRLKNHWWTFKKDISNQLCDEIVKYATSKNFEKGTVGSPKKELNLEEYQNNLKQIRDSNVVWLNEQWVHNEIIPYVTQANINANWNFELNGFESLQFTKYDVGQFYDWHPDQFEPVNEEDNSKKTYNERMSAQTSCEICGKTEELCYDHCHKTMEFRGVLCRACNRSLGQLGDNLEGIKKVLDYLERKHID